MKSVPTVGAKSLEILREHERAFEGGNRVEIRRETERKEKSKDEEKGKMKNYH